MTITDSSMSLRPVVTAGDTQLNDAQVAALREVRVTNGLGIPAHVRLAFSTGVADPTVVPTLGQSLVITVDGHGTDNWTIFDGIVVGLGLDLDSGFEQILTVEAYDNLYKLGRLSQAATYLSMKPGEVIKQLAGEVGLKAEIDSTFNPSVRPAAYQYGTAYAYIDSMVREAGFEWHVSGDQLKVTPRASGLTESVEVDAAGNLVSFNARMSATEHVDEVTVTGWDVVAKKAIVGSATSNGKGSRSVVDLASAAAVKKSDVGGTKALSIPRPVVDQKEADALATGIMHRREAGILRARGELLPMPGVEPGVHLEIKGLAGGWDGKYYCTEVEHVWGARDGSFKTYFEVGSAEPDSLVDLFGGSTTPTLDKMLGGLTIGVVTDNADPDGLYRVKMKLPYLSDTVETGWARVLQPGAGKGRGWNVLPEVDDEVLVGFEHGDIDHPYVLGGLVNGKDTPKYPQNEIVKSGKVSARLFNSRLGHELRFADGAASADQFVKINTVGKEATLFLGVEKVDLQAEGVAVKVYNDKGSIEITKDGDITLKGANIVLKSTQDITIDAGANVNIKSKASTAVTAKAKLDLKATAPATLESTAITSIKGSMVKIN
jgi:uncharacterized protein involved in type VI secretion and phage assembly